MGRVSKLSFISGLFLLAGSPSAFAENCIPIPQEYEIVHEIFKDDFRSSGEYETFNACERERKNKFPRVNAKCMKFLDARAAISPEEKSRWDSLKKRGGRCW